MIRRSARRVPAVLSAVVVLGAAAAVAVACAQLLLGGTPWIPFAALAAGAAGTAAGAAPVLVAAGVAAVVGLVLLGAALVPGPPRVLAVAGGDPAAGAALRVGATRRSLRRSLGAAARGVGGVERCTVRVGARRVTARVSTPLPDATEVGAEVRRVLGARLDDLALARPPRLRVRATTRRRQ